MSVCVLSVAILHSCETAIYPLSSHHSCLLFLIQHFFSGQCYRTRDSVELFDISLDLLNVILVITLLIVAFHTYPYI
ncbi:hypothetical protein C8J55DRAFT_514113 [Lentinula edodes]|uniref:Uncharacterized protein n=1 Tax=Lentinula lateritia TaxID=40482 RepID=A0A9W9DPD2_9AGAR|nr:hypothetical protein C8J55DRAFT_514113 [Lentinula edodes]